MASSRERELVQLSKKIVKLQIMGFIGAIMLAFGLYGIFGAHGHAIHPLLNDPRVVYGLLILGAVIQGWHYFKVVPLIRARARLHAEAAGHQPPSS